MQSAAGFQPLSLQEEEGEEEEEEEEKEEEEDHRLENGRPLRPNVPSESVSFGWFPSKMLWETM